MLQVYRVEHKETKVGPFQTNDHFTQQLARRATLNPLLRSPFYDGISMASLPYWYVFGCLDLPSLKRWMYQGESIQENEYILQKLKARGFRLAEYLVESERVTVGVSRLQVAFDAEESVNQGLVDYHDLDILLRESPYVFCDYAQILNDLVPLDG